MESRANLHQPTLESDKSIRGLAVVFYNPTDAGSTFMLNKTTQERIMSTAFDRAINEDDIVAVFNHDPSMILGRRSSGLTLTKTNRGIEYQIPPRNTRIYKEVRQHIENGDVVGSSFQFMPTEIRAAKEGEMRIREVWNAKLFDISPVTRPAYASSEATVRSWNEQEFEEELAKQERIKVQLALLQRRLRIIDLD